MGERRYKVQYNIGRCKYCVSFHNGESKHNDSSDFFDIAIFSNKKKLAQFERELKRGGYRGVS